MAEAVFQISAEITPTVDRRKLQQQGAVLQKEVTSALSKKLKPVNLKANTGSFTKEINRSRGVIGAFQRTIDSFQKKLRSFADTARTGFSKASSGARKGFLALTNALNVTNTKLIKFTGSIRQAVKDNKAFKGALNQVSRAGGTLKNLPEQFRTTVASIQSGTSELQRSAASGDKFSKSLLPFLVIGQTAVRQIQSLEGSLGQLTRTTFIATKNALGLKQTVSDFVRLDPALTGSVKSFRNLQNAVKGTAFESKVLLELERGIAAGKGPQEFTNSLLKLKAEAKKLAGPLGAVAAELGLVDRESRKTAKGAIKSINRSLLKEAPETLSSLEKIRTRLSLIGEQTVSAAKTATRGIKSISKDLAGLGQEFKEFSKEVGKDAGTVKDRLRTAFIGAKFAPQIDEKTFTAKLKNLGSRTKAFFETLNQTGGQRGALGLGFAGAIVNGFKSIFSSGKGLTKIATGPLKLLKGAVQGVSRAVSKLGQSLQGIPIIGPALNGYAIGFAAIIGLGAKALQSAAKFQRLGIALEGVFGKSSNAIDKFNTFAARTPFRLDDITEAGIKLASTLEGLRPEGAIEITKVIGSAAAASGTFSGETINRVILGLTQIESLGKATSDNVRQITEALPSVSRASIFKAIAEDIGKTKEEAQKLAEEGKVSSEQFAKAFLKAASSAPGAADALEKQSQTFEGLLSTTGDLLDQVFAKLGVPILKVASAILDEVNTKLDQFNEKLNNLPSPIKKIGDNLKFIVENTPLIGGIFRKAFNDAPLVFFEQGTQRVSNGLETAARAFSPVLRAVDALKGAIADLIEGNASLSDLEAGIDKVNEALRDTARRTLTEETEALRKVLDVKSAFEARAAATKAVADAQQQLNDFIAEHNQQLADKQIQLTEELANAQDQLTSASEGLADAQAALAEALKPASSEDLERADLSLASAKLRLRQILEDEKKAQDELNASRDDEEQLSVNLAGLSLDEVRSRLASFRAATAAQRATKRLLKDETSEKKSQEQLAIDEEEHQITKRETELDILDAEQAIQDLRQKGSEKDPAVIAARRSVRDATREEADAKQNVKDVQDQINGLDSEDKDFLDQKKNLEDQIVAAKAAEATAAQTVALKTAEAKNDQQGIIDILRQQIAETPGLATIYATVADQIKAGKDRMAELRAEAQGAIADAQGAINNIKGGLQGTNEQIEGFLKIVKEFKKPEGIKDLGNGFVLNQNASPFSSGNLRITSGRETLNDLGNASSLLTKAVGGLTTVFDDVNKIKDFLNLPFAEGTVTSGPTSALIGEAGREAVLPLTRPQRMLDILSNKHVLPPVLTALERLVVSGSGSNSQIGGGSLASTRALGLSRSGTPDPNSKQERQKRDKALARAIVEEMKAAGFTSGSQTEIINNFPETNGRADPNGDSKARKVAREIQRQIERNR